MKKSFLCLVFLIGIFAFSCTAPPDIAYRTDQPPGYAQVITVDQASVQTDFVFVINPVALPSPDTPVQSLWMTEISKAVALSANSERSVHKMYSSDYISNVNTGYQLSTFYIPDKSNQDGNFSNRDKLTQDAS